MRNTLIPCLVLGTILCSSLARAGLIHRYSFNDGSARDSVGKVDATLRGDAKITGGKLVLANPEKASDDPKLSYLEFNSRIIPASGSVSLVVWISAKEHAPYARVIDVGDSEGGEGRAFMYLVIRHEDDKSRGSITATDTNAKTFVSGNRLDDDKPHMAAVVIDGTAKKLHLYVDGKESATPEDLGENTLDKVRPVHNWLGRSAFDENPGLTASIDEFRVYDHALSPAEVEAINKAGADVVGKE